MSRLCRVISLVGLVCLFFALPVHADTMYTVNGTMTLVGNNACGSPCTETIDFSFDLGWQYDQTFAGYLGYATDIAANWSGALGTFSENSAGPSTFGGPGFNYLGFFDPSGDELDLYLNPNPVPAPTTPTFNGADLYSCGGATCVTDFYPYSPTPTTLPVLGIFLGASVTYTVTTPEPATLIMLAIGMLALALVGAFYRKAPRPAS